MRALVRATATVAAGMVLALGCDDGASSGATSVSLVVFGEAEELRAYRTLTESFEAAQDDVDVELIEVPDRDALITRVSTSIAAGEPPDLFLVNYRFLGQFTARGLVEPVQARLDASDVLDEDELYDVALAAFRDANGQLQCLPQNVSSLVVYFNRDMFAAAGVPAPTAGWTWDDMVAAATALTSGERYGVGIEPSLIRLAPFVWSNGGALVDDEHRPTRLLIQEPPAVEALERFLALWRDGVTPPPEAAAAEDDEARFMNGRLAMYLNSRRVTPQLRLIDGFEWDIAPLPTLGEPAGVLHADAYCMPAASPDHDAAFAFVEYALGPDGAPVIAQTGRTVPSLMSVATSGAFVDSDRPPASSSVFLDTIPAIRQLPTISTWPEIESVAAEILEAAVADGTPADVVARQLDEATLPLFARAE